MFEFLAGLNREFDEVRGRILSRRPLPTTREVFAEVRREEARWNVMLKEKTIGALDVTSALLIKGNSNDSAQKHLVGPENASALVAKGST